MNTARRESLALLVLVAVGLVCYANSFQNGFVWDDHLQVLNNRLLRSWSFAPQFFTADAADAYGVSGQLVRFYRPLWLLTEMAEYQLFGPHPFGFHLVNFLLHLGAALLFYFVLREAQVRRALALLAAALFLCHPAHLETTTFIAGSVGVLSEFFMFAGLLAFLKFLRAQDAPGRRWTMLALSAAAYAAALLSKEIAVTLPVVVFAAVLMLPGDSKPGRRGWLAAGAVYGLVTAAYFAARYRALAKPMYPHLYSWPVRCVLALRALAAYIGLAVVPASLYPEKTVLLPGWPGTLLAVAGVAVAAGLVMAAAWFWKRDRRVSFGLVWFVAGFSLISNIIPVKPTFADRWLYWPLPGLLLAGAAAVEFALRKKGTDGRGVLIAGWCAVAVFSGLTISQNRVWRDDTTLFETTIRRGGGTSLIRTALALTEMDEGKFGDAREQLETAIKQDPGNDTALWAMGACFAAAGDYAAATNWYARSLVARPTEMRTVSSLALAQEQLGDLTAAAGTLQDWRARTGSPFIAAKLANFYYRHDRLDDAGNVLRETLAQHPDYAPAHNSLGTVLFRQDRVDEAEREFRQALRFDPWLAFAHANLAAIANRRGDFNGALQEYNNALDLDPQNPGFYRALAMVLDQHGQPAAAAQALHQAQKIEATHPGQDLLP